MNLPGTINFPFFLLSSVLYSLTPGIDFLLVLNRSMFFGRRAGMLTSLGVHAGLVCHTLLAALGVSALISSSEVAFPIIQYAGAGYLIIFGLLTVINSRKKNVVQPGEQPKQSAGYFFLSGLTADLFNPKVILFFLAFFPQFVSQDSVGDILPYLYLGATYTIVSLLCVGVLCVVSSAFASRVLKSPRFTILMHRVTGCLFILMGISVAFMER